MRYRAEDPIVSERQRRIIDHRFNACRHSVLRMLDKFAEMSTTDRVIELLGELSQDIDARLADEIADLDGGIARDKHEAWADGDRASD